MDKTRALATMLTEQDHDGVLPGHQRSGYHFKSDTQSSEKMPVGYTGMIWVAFRPSDDECLYNFPIPVEIQAGQALNALAEMERFIGRRDTAKRAETLGEQVKAQRAFFRRNIMFNLPMLPKQPTADPSSVWHPWIGTTFHVRGVFYRSLRNSCFIPSHATESRPRYRMTLSQ
jgi:hypothetical protein